MSVLIVEDSSGEARLLLSELKKLGLTCEWAASLTRAKELCGTHRFTHALVDYHLPDGTGLDFLKWTQTLSRKPQLYILSAYGSISKAVEAIHNGALDFFEKPVQLKDLQKIFANPFTNPNATPLNQANPLFSSLLSNLGFIHTKGSPLEKSLQLARIIADKSCHVYLFGESGTGKEVMAKLIHHFGRESSAPFVPVNCAAIPENLMESELFGYRKGAFTGATENRRGKFEAAHNGTLFLDEIGDLSLSAQTKLLRVLQERKFTPLGANDEIETHFRLLFATHKNLEELVKKGLFREDLFYRLNLIQIFIPPLRKRTQDIVPLIKHFLEKHLPAHELEKAIQTLPDYFQSYAWPGNIRELKNTVERYLIYREMGMGWSDALPVVSGLSTQTSPVVFSSSLTKRPSDDDIKSALDRFHGHREKTAKYLNISRRTLQYRLAKWESSL